jgi:hypothetical protein
MHMPLFPLGNIFLFPVDAKLGGPQRWSGYFGENKNLLSLWGIEVM